MLLSCLHIGIVLDGPGENTLVFFIRIVAWIGTEFICHSSDLRIDIRARIVRVNIEEAT